MSRLVLYAPELDERQADVSKEVLGPPKKIAYDGDGTMINSRFLDGMTIEQAKAAMAMMPDVTQLQNVVAAMQGVMSSGGSAFESMQKVMGDFARMSGMKR